jgi:hypothetical protein
MAFLPPLIEFLLAQTKPSGENLVVFGGVDYEITAFPPNTTVKVSSSPGEGEFAWIVYMLNFDPSVVPRAWRVYCQQYGARSYDGILTSAMTNNLLPFFVVATKTQPSIASITNISNLAQYLALQSMWLTVKTSEDYELVKEALRRYGVSAKSEALAQEANTLLKQLLASQRPPIIVTPPQVRR